MTLSFVYVSAGMLLLVQVLLIPTMRASELACDAQGAAPCPDGSRCVPGAGCVALEAACRCPQGGCGWPQRCDCKGACRAHPCASVRDCGKQLVNPADACQTLHCQASSKSCVARAANCSGCDRVTGCPAKTRPVLANNNEDEAVEVAPRRRQSEPRVVDEPRRQARKPKPAEETEEDYDYNNQGAQGGAVSLESVQAHSVPATYPPYVVGLITFICIWGVIFLAIFIYLCWVNSGSWKGRKSG